MAAPNRKSGQTSQGNFNATGGTMSAAASTTSGNVGLVFVTVDGNTGIALSGYTQVALLNNGIHCTAAVFKRELTGSDDGTFTISPSKRGSWIFVEYEGSPDLANIEATTGTGAGSDADCPSHTPSGGSDDYLYIAFAGIDRSAAASVAPSGYSNLLSENPGSGASATTNIAEKSTTASSSDNPGPFDSNAEDYVVMTVSVPPASGGAVTSDLPTAANISIAGNAITAVGIANVTSELPAAQNIAIEGDAVTTAATANVSTTLPTAENINIEGNAVTSEATANVTSELPTAADMSIEGNAPTAVGIANVVSELPSAANISINGNAVTASADASVTSELPTAANINLEGNAVTTAATANVNSELPSAENINLNGNIVTATVAGSVTSELPTAANINLAGNAVTVEASGADEGTPKSQGTGGSTRKGKRGNWEDTKVSRKPRKRKRKRRRKKRDIQQEIKEVVTSEESTAKKIVALQKILDDTPEYLRPELQLRKHVEIPKYPEPLLNFDIYNKFLPPSVFGLPAPFMPLPETGFIPDPNAEIPQASRDLMQTRIMLAKLDPEFASYDDDVIRAIHVAIYDEDIAAQEKS